MRMYSVYHGTINSWDWITYTPESFEKFKLARSRLLNDPQANYGIFTNYWLAYACSLEQRQAMKK